MSSSPSFVRRFVVLAALVVCALGASASTASANLLWTANAERPWSQEWANYSCESGDRVQEVASPAAQGKRAYRIEVRDGDDSYGERCELGQANPTRGDFPLFQEGQERWIGYQVYLPEDLNTDLDAWTVIMQLKQLGSLGTPAVAMDFENGHFIFMTSDTNHESSGCDWWWQHPVVKGRWIKFLYHIKFSPDRNVGWTELYSDIDGDGVKQVMPRTHMLTMKQEGGKAVPSHSRIGLYRDPKIKGTEHIFYDGYSVGTDRGSVEGAAFEGGTSYVSPADPARATAARSGKRRVWLKLKRHGLLSTASGLSPWGRILAVYGGVRGKKRHRPVIIQIRRNGHWQSLTRGWLRRNGRFYLTPSVDTASRVVKLRAVVRGVGHSKVLRVHLR
jgi:hypothetical protein